MIVLCVLTPQLPMFVEWAEMNAPNGKQTKTESGFQLPLTKRYIDTLLKFRHGLRGYGKASMAHSVEAITEIRSVT